MLTAAVNSYASQQVYIYSSAFLFELRLAAVHAVAGRSSRAVPACPRFLPPSPRPSRLLPAPCASNGLVSVRGASRAQAPPLLVVRSETVGDAGPQTPRNLQSRDGQRG